jgi:hypothetical protein
MVTQTEVKTLHKQQISHILNNTQTNLDSGIQLWGTASTSNIENLERFQSKDLNMILHAPQRYLQTPAVKEEICCYSSQYTARLSAYPKEMICLPHS